MDLRNVVFAIALSFAVLFGWSVIFETPEIEKQKKIEQLQNQDQKSSAPSVNLESISNTNISREDAIKSNKRIKFENENVSGSISLKGALIDDITFKKYDETLEADKKVTYLNPAETNDGYFVETGWAASNLGNMILPNTETIWKIKGNDKLTEGNPVEIEWNNKDEFFDC